jgi:hypothetical protein
MVNVDALYAKICMDLLDTQICELYVNCSRKYLEQKRYCIGMLRPESASANARLSRNMQVVLKGELEIDLNNE